MTAKIKMIATSNFIFSLVVSLGWANPIGKCLYYYEFFKL
jgi:hypothetical protein